jgi:hypothetical protein
MSIDEDHAFIFTYVVITMRIFRMAAVIDKPALMRQ